MPRIYKKERKCWFLKRPHISIKKEYEGEIDRNKLSVLFLSGNCVQGKFIWIVIRDSVLFFLIFRNVIYLYFQIFYQFNNFTLLQFYFYRDKLVKSLGNHGS